MQLGEVAERRSHHATSTLPGGVEKRAALNVRHDRVPWQNALIKRAKTRQMPGRRVNNGGAPSFLCALPCDVPSFCSFLV
jgi:hypothetical protein